MREIALHLLDIAENSVAADARTIRIAICEDLQNDRLSASVTDDGKGMDAVTLRRVTDPFVTSRTTRKVGLGIPLLKAAAEACRGWLEIRSEPGKGTCLETEFQHSHIDRMPLGDLAGTLLTLVVAYPQIHWIFDYRAIAPAIAPAIATAIAPLPTEPVRFTFDDAPVKAELGDIPLSEPEVLAFLRTYIEEGLAGAREMLPEFGGINL